MKNCEGRLEVRRQWEPTEGGNPIPEHAEEGTLRKEEGILEGAPVGGGGVKTPEGPFWGYGRRSIRGFRSFPPSPPVPATGDSSVGRVRSRRIRGNGVPGLCVKKARGENRKRFKRIVSVRRASFLL